MCIESFFVDGLRNLNNIEFIPDHKYNFIIGENGSGKTSILESLHLLGTGRSFRTKNNSKLIHYEKEACQVIAKDQETNQIGIEKQRNGKSIIKLNSKKIERSSALAAILPMQLYSPDSFKIIDSSSKLRRSILDWGMFHVKHQYFEALNQYQNSLKQRNRALKETIDKTLIFSWNQSLSDQAEKLHQMRESYVEQLLPIFFEIYESFKGKELAISYFKGWGSSKNNLKLSACLEESLERELILKHTIIGAHRADLVFKHQKNLIKDIFSRGQQKLVIIALKLAQGILLSNVTDKKSVYLLDDLGAEFDENSLRLIASYIAQINGQFYITTLDNRLIKVFSEFLSGEMFHVKHGRVS